MENNNQSDRADLYSALLRTTKDLIEDYSNDESEEIGPQLINAAVGVLKLSADSYTQKDGDDLNTVLQSMVRTKETARVQPPSSELQIGKKQK